MIYVLGEKGESVLFRLCIINDTLNKNMKVLVKPTKVTKGSCVGVCKPYIQDCPTPTGNKNGFNRSTK